MGLWDFIKQVLRFAVAAWWAKITEKHGHSPSNNSAKYSLEYPEKYTKEYFTNGFQDYRWNPDYIRPINNLYDDRVKNYKEKRLL